METNCHFSRPLSAFNHPSQAIQDAEWINDPANPTRSGKGILHKGETVWFHDDLFGSGPLWQQVRLIDNSLVYVNPHHFESLTRE
ncbi:hypothetical protein GCM10028808_40490 [Spirosoma migulaei]